METELTLAEALERQTHLLNRLARPYVIADVYPRFSVNVLYFRIRNVGQTPAYDIRPIIDPPIPFRKASSSDLDIFKGAIGVLGPQEQISFFYDSAVDLFSKQDTPLQFHVNVRYVDSDKIAYDERFSIDVNLLRGLALEMPVADKVFDELQSIRKEIETIAKYTESVRSKQLYADLHRSKKRATKNPKPK